MKNYAFSLLMTACVSAGALAQTPGKSVGVERIEGIATASQGSTPGNIQSNGNGNVPMTTANGKPLPLGEGLAIGLRRRQNSSGS